MFKLTPGVLALIVALTGCSTLADFDCSEVQVVDDIKNHRVTVRAPLKSEIETVELVETDNQVTTVQVKMRRQGIVTLESILDQEIAGDSNQHLGVIRNGMREGFWIHFSSGGSINETGFYLHGLMHGQWKTWNHLSGKDGHVLHSTAWYNAGRLNGPFIEWHNDRKLKCKGSYADGLEEGLWRKYHGETGHLWVEGDYRAGKRNGVWTEYGIDGKLQSVGTYVDGILVEEKRQ